jgi:uncharacterized protein YbjT (DUF2867 family)
VNFRRRDTGSTPIGEDAAASLSVLGRAPELIGVDPYQPDFTVVGVHSPEFAFERSVENVERAVREHGLEYPVGLDNDFIAWNAYGNRYWPTIYLIDRAGQVRYTHIGEGNYGRTEAAIRALLAEAVDPAAETEAAS